MDYGPEGCQTRLTWPATRARAELDPHLGRAWARASMRILTLLPGALPHTPIGFSRVMCIMSSDACDLE